MTTFSVVFVCRANLCRSPTAHAVLRKKIRAQGLVPWVRVDSASTHDNYPSGPPDARTQQHAARRGYDLSDLRSRPIQLADFEKADLVRRVPGEGSPHHVGAYRHREDGVSQVMADDCEILIPRDQGGPCLGVRRCFVG